jgi:outer membrane protein assembly factor BamA
MRSFVILAALAACDPQGEGVRPMHPQGVQSVALDGRSLPMPALREVLATHPGDALDRTRLEKDRAALESALVARGYLAAKVLPPQINWDADGGAYVTYAISQGALFHVRSVAVTGATARDTGVVTLAAGDPVEADRLARVRDALGERLAARGKRAGVRVELAPDENAAAVDVELVVR